MDANARTKNYSTIKIFESWATLDNPFGSTEDILSWIEEQKRSTTVNIDKIDYDYSGDWYYDSDDGVIRRRDNAFFQISGLTDTEEGKVVHEQPIILQDEIGYLGIIGKVIDGVLYFLMQAKIEPGNVNVIQISPTIQATKSNFMQAHGGKTPAYLEFFSNKNDYEVIVDQIQSEQSSRFYGKRNRNIIIIVDDDVEVLKTHRWMTLGQIKELMQYDNLVNMDTRTVISCIPISMRSFSQEELSYLHSIFDSEELYRSVFRGDTGSSFNKVFQYMNDVKMMDKGEVDLVGLRSLKDWRFDKGEFCSDKGEFSLVFCDIEIEGREVRRWQQPLLEAKASSVFALMYCIEDGEVQYLIQTKREVGCFDKIEIGPSVQMSPSEDPNDDPVNALFDRKFRKNEGVRFSGLFSEEGGRFYHEQNRNVIMEVDRSEIDSLPIPDGYFWVNYQTLNILIQFNNCLNIQLRNILSLLKI